MDETEGSNYWCHMCSQIVSPIVEVECFKCPICRGEFVEEMASGETIPGTNDDDPFDSGASDSDRAVSLWAPILMDMMSNHRRLRQFRSIGFDEDDDENNNVNIHHSRRRSTNVLRLLHAAMQSGLENSEHDHRDGGRVILIDPFNQRIVIRRSNDANGNPQDVPIGSLGDYFVGPNLEMLLQHLAENDPNRYGTPPAKKEAVEALPDVKIEGTFQCSVCLEEFENGGEAKEMPCNHKFHSGCILPWLELHSSCPVCRYQLPSDESKINTELSRNNSRTRGSNEGNGIRQLEESSENGRHFSLPWPFSSLFTSSGSESSNASSPSSSSGPSTNIPPATSHPHDD